MILPLRNVLGYIVSLRPAQDFTNPCFEKQVYKPTNFLKILFPKLFYFLEIKIIHTHTHTNIDIYNENLSICEAFKNNILGQVYRPLNFEIFLITNKN